MSLPVIRAERGPHLLQRVANHPDVVGWIRPDGGPTDWGSLFDPAGLPRQGVVVLSDGECAASIFEPLGGGAYQGHTLFAPPCRGQRAVRTGLAMVQWMFRNGATALWGSTPLSNRRALLFNRMIGACSVPQLSGPDAEVFVFRRATWAARTGLPVD